MSETGISLFDAVHFAFFQGSCVCKAFVVALL